MVDEKQGKVLKIVMAAILLVSMYFVAREGAAYVASENVVGEKGEKACVVIDAGHGGTLLRPNNSFGKMGEILAILDDFWLDMW